MDKKQAMFGNASLENVAQFTLQTNPNVLVDKELRESVTKRKTDAVHYLGQGLVPDRPESKSGGIFLIFETRSI